LKPLHLTITLCLVFVAIVLGAFIYSVTRTPTLSDEALREMGVFVLPTPREITPHGLTTQTGAPFASEDLEGRWSFLFFGFTNCPDICPTTMAELAKARRQLAEEAPEAVAEFQGVMVSVDPERDDVETLGRYVTAFSPTFLGVRGSRADLADLASQVNAVFAKVPGDDGDYQVDHSANVVIVNPRGHYHGFAKLPHQADTIVAAFTSLRDRWQG
jgi:protein SCO1/2